MHASTPASRVEDASNDGRTRRLSSAQARAGRFPLHQSRARPKVAYGRLAAAEPHHWAEIRRLLDGQTKRICDVGGGAKPILPLDEIEESALDYHVLDISAEQLERAPAGYQKHTADVCDPVAMSAFV